MFDFDISLFMLSMWINIVICYFDCSHVSIEFQCIHTYMSLLSLLVCRTKVGIRTGKVGIRTGRWWMYRLQS